MKNLLLFLLPWFLTFTFFTAFWIGLLCFMIADPDKWSKWIEKQHAFFVRIGISSPSFSEKCKRFENGVGMKLLAGCGILLGAVGLLGVGFTLVRFVLFHRR